MSFGRGSSGLIFTYLHTTVVRANAAAMAHGRGHRVQGTGGGHGEDTGRGHRVQGTGYVSRAWARASVRGAVLYGIYEGACMRKGAQLRLDAFAYDKASVRASTVLYGIHKGKLPPG